MVFRIYTEKREGLGNEAESLLRELRDILKAQGVTGVRVLNRYDAEGLTEDVFEKAAVNVFSEPQTDLTYRSLSGVLASCGDEKPAVFAVEYLPGQFDQRADSAAQCIQIMTQGKRPVIRSAKVYLLFGDISGEDLLKIKKYVINPVEAREAALDRPETLEVAYGVPTEVATLHGFISLDREGLEAFIRDYGLAMDIGDILFCQQYFREERRDPTITEIRMIDTYWSDHCRHTTFLTTIDDVVTDDEVINRAFRDYLDLRREVGRTKPVNLMDIATIAVKALKKQGKLEKLDESEEINACTVKIEVEADGVREPWLLLFKNETHNHPTEIEPFGGAATCIGGAIRDPLSGRAYVYGAMRLTGASDPTVPVEETIPGKLPQRKLVTTAAAGYSSYGNQIGLTTGIVDEIYHPGYAAKHMEVGAVIGAVPEAQVRRERPAPGDLVVLLGGRTGRDGIGGATGSSKAHTASSVETCSAEVQKGNAPEERKLQRMFRKASVCRMIKRCNDFGAGGVSVAIGELADGLRISLDAVPKKYDGLDGTELAISESQERMAVVIAPEDLQAFLKEADAENLEATVTAVVTEEPRLVMSWNGKDIVNISREFLNSNGAEKHMTVCPAPAVVTPKTVTGTFRENLEKTVSDLNVCSKRGLSERFDATIGAGSVFMPFGGKDQLTPIQAMAQKISMEEKHTDDCSVMAWGYDPELSSESPYHGAYSAVVESVSKLVASGASFEDVYLTFQEYFEKPGHDGKRWGKPLSALLGAMEAQMALGIGAVGGKDSMSGSFENLDVPPTLISFAVTTDKAYHMVSPELKEAGHRLVLLSPEKDRDGLPVTESLLGNFRLLTKLFREGNAFAAYTLQKGGIAEAAVKMAMGNGLGVKFEDGLAVQDLFEKDCGAFLVECAPGTEAGTPVGTVLEVPVFILRDEAVPADELYPLYEGKLEPVYPVHADAEAVMPVEDLSVKAEAYPAPAVKCVKPRVLIPAFPGTNCEYDSARAFRDAGAEPEIVVIRNRTEEDIRWSVEQVAGKIRESQIVFLPGGFSGGDEPDGSGKFITSFFRNPGITDAVRELLDEREGLMAGICNGFQALVKLGLVPYGKIVDASPDAPTLTFNTIGRHQSKIVTTRIASNRSPWLALTEPGMCFKVPISHGEGRFYASPEVIRTLIENGQVATQYADPEGHATMEIQYNPNGSVMAVEGITSPDGRVFGKMGHSERIGKDLYRNVPGNYDIRMFEAAVRYYRLEL